MKFLLLLLFFTTHSYAQTKEDNAPGILCRFICLSHTQPALTELYATKTNAKIQLSLTSGTSSARLIPTDQKIHFFTKPQDPDQKPESPLTTALIPKGAKQVVILFLPVSASEKPTYETIVFNLDPKSIPPDGSAIMNLNRTNVRFGIGEHRFELPPGKTISVPRPSNRDKYNMADVFFQFKTETEWRTAYESTVRFPENQQKLFITYLDSKTKRPKARSYNINRRYPPSGVDLTHAPPLSSE